MVSPAQAEKAARFSALHHTGVFLLPNVWDVASAALVAAAGFEAIATTSSGVAFTHGRVDGDLGKTRMLADVAEIARRSPIPVTADLEAGYGGEPEAVAQTVRDAIEAGAVGCNIEDTDPTQRRLYDFDLAVARIAAAAGAARDAGLEDFVVNARTDPFLRGFGEPASWMGESVRRANAYAAAGAKSLFVPGPDDAETIAALARQIDGPLNVLARPKTPPLAELARLGVRRVSVGGGLTGATYGFAARILAQLRQEGGFAFLAEGLSHAEMMKSVSGFGHEA
jgi:2-methylisocitrate lyase-like PEP mutase family enzyme